jgi:tRNA U34 2-thiouridine synthase MnmA/TrmU
VKVRGACLRRPGERVDRVKLRYRSKPLPAAVLGDPPAGRHASLEIELGQAAEGVAPGQLACLMEGELVLGWGTIGRA